MIPGATPAMRAWAPLRAQDPADVTEMELEDLLNVRVTRAARKPQPLSNTPAAPLWPCS